MLNKNFLPLFIFILLSFLNISPKITMVGLLQAQTSSSDVRPSTTKTVAGQQYTLEWWDNFDGTSLSSYWWNVSNEISGGNKNLRYTPDAVSVSNGNLVITGSLRNDGYYYTGDVNTKNKFTLTYGYVEGRMKLSKGNGVWPSFWMVPQENVWPPEIDIFELEDGRYPNEIYLTYHYPDASCANNDCSLHTTYVSSVDYSAGYHTFAVNWEPTKITWYIDDTQRYQVTNYDVSIVNLSNFIEITQYLVKAGSWPNGAPYWNTLPVNYYIDYVAVYKKSSSAPAFSPASGTYTSAQRVSISTPTTGATIYYTLDGSDPATSSTRAIYTSAILVSSTKTIKAKAFKTGMNPSVTVSATYTINAPTLINLAPNPSFELNPNDAYEYSGVGSFYWAEDYMHTGTKSLKIVSSQPTGQFCRFLSKIGTITGVAGKTYTASVWMKTSNVSQYGELLINFWDAKMAYLDTYYISNHVSGTSNWTKLTVSCIAPANTKYIKLHFKLFGPGKVWIDDVELK